MEVKLLHITPMQILVQAIRKCYDSGDVSDSKAYYDDILHKDIFRLGQKDEKLINQIIKSGHTSTLEHICINFDIIGFSRDVLQEFSRHRVGTSPSVKSTRFTLKELANEEPFIELISSTNVTSNCSYWEYNWNKIKQYCVLTDNSLIDRAIASALENARCLKQHGLPNDKVKYCLPGAYKTAGIYTFNIRSLRNLLELRTAPDALWEFRELAFKLYNSLPDQYKFLVKDCVYNEQT